MLPDLFKPRMGQVIMNGRKVNFVRDTETAARERHIKKPGQLTAW
jgi:hypothetical protein